MFKKIYVNGSSLSCGGSLELDSPNYDYYVNQKSVKPWKSEKEVAYGNILANKLGIECFNDSKQGGGLDRIIRKTFDYIDNLSEEEIRTTLFIFDIPLQPSRMELYSKEFQDHLVVSIYDREWENNVDGKMVRSNVSFSRSYKNPSLRLPYDTYMRHNLLISKFAKEYYDYENETKRLVRQLILFYNFLDNKKITYNIDLNDSLFTASGQNCDELSVIYKNNYSYKLNPNILVMDTLWLLSVENNWRLCDEIEGSDDSHLGYYGNIKYADYILDKLNKA
jgi:hypothetical protein